MSYIDDHGRRRDDQGFFYDNHVVGASPADQGAAGVTPYDNEFDAAGKVSAASSPGFQPYYQLPDPSLASVGGGGADGFVESKPERKAIFPYQVTLYILFVFGLFVFWKLWFSEIFMDRYPIKQINASQSYDATRKIKGIDIPEARYETFLPEVVALYRPGTNMSLIWNYCDKWCYFADMKAFQGFKKNAINPLTYENDVCRLHFARMLSPDRLGTSYAPASYKFNPTKQTCELTNHKEVGLKIYDHNEQLFVKYGPGIILAIIGLYGLYLVRPYYIKHRDAPEPEID